MVNNAKRRNLELNDMENRIFIPGSKWLYFKVYTGTKTADEILIQDISPLINIFYKNGWIEKWFFIRYSDGDFHLRVRILVKDEAFSGEVLSLFCRRMNKLVQQRTVWKIQMDTYQRELERYGKELMEEAESIFCIDSDCIVSLIKQLRYQDENYRWMIALKMIDSLLSDFSCDLASKQALMQELSLSFKKEFHFTESNSEQFAAKYRAHKTTVEKVLKEKMEDMNFNALYPILLKKSKKMKPVVQQIKAKMGINKTETMLRSLIGSYLHMMLNRLFRSKNRTHELLLYDFMNCYYKSEMAKIKYGKA